MTDPHTSTDARIHEPDTLSGRTMIGWGCALAVLVVAALAMMAGLLKLFESETVVRAIEEPAAAREAAPVGATAASPVADALAEARAAQRFRLNSYGWVDEQQRIAHVPIERAMQLLLERGVRSREASHDEN